uniref:Uncharacterized protein n=1 Tax=Acrobeloides nanus TaxID=290746 RepID=A0A914C2K7_9BILA
MHKNIGQGQELLQTLQLMSKSCEIPPEQPEPREECPAAQPNWVPLFVGHGVVAWSGKLMQVQNPKAICDCDTSSKLYYADILEVHPNYLKQVETYNKLTYTLNNKQGCPQMCIRTTDGKFWEATESDPVVVLIATYCEGSICYNYAGLESGTLKHDANEFKPTTTNNNQNNMGESSAYLKVDAISCQGCAMIAEEATEQCYAIS